VPDTLFRSIDWLFVCFFKTSGEVEQALKDATAKISELQARLQRAEQQATQNQATAERSAKAAEAEQQLAKTLAELNERKLGMLVFLLCQFAFTD